MPMAGRDDDPRKDDDETDDLACARGIMNALPISLALWLLIFVLARVAHIF
jgi:hypothetical protein